MFIGSLQIGVKLLFVEICFDAVCAGIGSKETLENRYKISFERSENDKDRASYEKLRIKLGS